MRILKKIAIGLLVLAVVLVGIGWWIVRGDPAEHSVADVTGTDPVIAEPDAQTIPTVDVAAPVGWAKGQAPEAAEGLAVNRFAEGLEHPRVIYPHSKKLGRYTASPGGPAPLSVLLGEPTIGGQIF